MFSPLTFPKIGNKCGNACAVFVSPDCFDAFDIFFLFVVPSIYYIIIVITYM